MPDADDGVVVVEHGGLPGRDAVDRLVEDELEAARRRARRSPRPPASGGGASPRRGRASRSRRPRTATRRRASERAGPTTTVFGSRLGRERRRAARPTRRRGPRRWPGVKRQKPSWVPSRRPSSSTIGPGLRREPAAARGSRGSRRRRGSRPPGSRAVRRRRGRRPRACAAGLLLRLPAEREPERGRAMPASSVASM